MKNGIKLIRISVFSILLLMLMTEVIVEYVDIVKNRTILFIILYVALILLIVMLGKEPKCAISRIMVLDLLSIVFFILLMVSLSKGISETEMVLSTFEGNNGYICSYSKGIGSKGYDDIESALKDQIEYRNKTSNQNELEEIYRIQVEEKNFVYFKEAEWIAEFEFFRQNDLYYSSGTKDLMYDGIGSSDSYTAEETIRKDIANTMWRGVSYDEVGAPAWGVSTDEQISSMSINAEPVDDVILINEIDGKKYYFWITTNVEGIETIDDVKAAEIEMNNLQ